MVDSGAVTHVCPPETTLHKLQQGEGKDLRTATDDIIVYGYKRINMINSKDQAILIPLEICDVPQPILSATCLAEQGLEIVLGEQATMQHSNGFEATLKPQRFVLSDNEDNRRSNQHKIWRLRNRTRDQGSHLTRHNDSNRSQVGYTQL